MRDWIADDDLCLIKGGGNNYKADNDLYIMKKIIRDYLAYKDLYVIKGDLINCKPMTIYISQLWGDLESWVADRRGMVI